MIADRRSLRLLLFLLLPACSGGPESGADRHGGAPATDWPPAGETTGPAVELIDDAGRAVRLDAPARRIVSLVPSVTETIVALGEAGRLIARTDYDRGPAVLHLPSLGGGLDPSPEALIALGPDLVVGWSSARDGRLRGFLETAGIPFYAAAIEDTTDVFRTFDRVGRLLGARTAAERLAGAVRDSLAAVAAERPPGPRPTVLFTLLGGPPRTAGPDTFVAQLVEIAGGRPAFPELDERWPEVSLEAVVARQPDVLVVPVEPGDRPLARLADRDGWRDLAAVRAGRVVGVDADLFTRPGPRLPQAARALQRALREVGPR
ncbi:MAG TPA: helical backbone metal receptor [Gemmatimonadota bacterium]|nr:helical backbone metal receptor [Gemmatimonadota bacterium]